MSSIVVRAPMKCPVCQVKFRANTVCSRCYTDLTAMMSVAARAAKLRAEARQALLADDLLRALRLSAYADQLHRRGIA